MFKYDFYIILFQLISCIFKNRFNVAKPSYLLETIDFKYNLNNHIFSN